MSGIFYTDYTFEYPNDNVLIATSSFEEVPSNQLPLINLSINGILKPSDKPYIFKIIIKNGPTKDLFAAAYGTFVIGNKVYNASKIVKPEYVIPGDKMDGILTITLDMKNTCYEHVQVTKRFSFSVQLNDCSCYCCCQTQGCFY